MKMAVIKSKEKGIEGICVNYKALKYCSTFEVISSTFHECRHIWQEKNCPEILSDYKQAKKTKTKKKYNEQFAEVDAYAFANALMIVFYKKRLTFNFDKNLEIAVLKQTKIILKDLKKQKIIE